MNITRRQFMQYCMASAAALGLSQTDLLKLEKAFGACTQYTGVPSVIWLQGQNCSGCVTSILNRVIDVSGGYYDGDMSLALYNVLAVNGASQPAITLGTASEPVTELNAVNDIADLLVGDAVAAVVPQLGALFGSGAGTPRTGPGIVPWANFPNGYVTMDWNMTVAAGAGDIDVAHMAPIVNAGGFVLVVEGSTPTGANGDYCWVFDDDSDVCGQGWGTGGHSGHVTMQEALLWMAPKALAVINMGTCSSFGGIPAARRQLTDAKSSKQVLEEAGYVIKPTTTGDGDILMINVPGCPPDPDWMFYPVAYIIIHVVLALVPPNDLSDLILDENLRPFVMYPGTHCEVCPNKWDREAEFLGDSGCMKPLGCKGAYVKAACARRFWNRYDDGTKNNWCVGSGDCIGDGRHPCQGCTEPGFPDDMSPFYRPGAE